MNLYFVKPHHAAAWVQWLTGEATDDELAEKYPDVFNEDAPTPAQLAEMQRMAKFLQSLDTHLEIKPFDISDEPFLALSGGTRLPDLEIYTDHIWINVPVTAAHVAGSQADALDAAFRADVLAVFEREGLVAIHEASGQVITASGFSFRSYLETGAEVKTDFEPHTPPEPPSFFSPPPGPTAPPALPHLSPGEQVHKWWKFWA